MADVEQAEKATAESGGNSSKMITGGIVVLMAAIGGLCTYLFVLKPMLGDPEAIASENQVKTAALGVEIPLMPVPVVFEAVPVSVIRQGNQPAPTLLFGITFECNDAATAELVQKYKYRFHDMLIKLHDSRTRSELDDTVLLKESIQRQAMQKANDVLERLQEEPSSNVRITAVLHHMFVVSEQS